MQYDYKLRPHHGMCINYFVGNGYSEDFTSHMASMIEALSEDPVVCLSTETDAICVKCPNNVEGTCTTGTKSAQYDREVLKRCNLLNGTCLHYSEFSHLIQTLILQPGIREEICGDCQWNMLCR